MPVTDYYWQDTPANLDSIAVSSGLGDIEDQIAYNILNKSPWIWQLTGMPGDTEAMFDMGDRGTGGFELTDGGPALLRPMVFQQGNSVQPIKGYDEYTISGSDEFRHLQYAYRWAVLPVAISREEERANTGGRRGKAILKLLDRKVEVAERVFADWLNDRTINSDGTGTDGKEPLGLRGHIPSNPSTAGTTIGGWDVAANASLRPHYNADITGVVAGAAGVFATVGASRIREMYYIVYRALNAREPRLLLCSHAVYAAWEAQLEGREQVTYSPGALGRKVLQDGIDKILYKQAMVMEDPAVPTGMNAVANNNLIYFLTLGGDSLRLQVDREEWMAMSEFTPHKGQRVRSAELSFAGNMTGGSPRLNGILDGFTT